MQPLLADVPILSLTVLAARARLVRRAQAKGAHLPDLALLLCLVHAPAFQEGVGPARAVALGAEDLGVADLAGGAGRVAGLAARLAGRGCGGRGGGLADEGGFAGEAGAAVVEGLAGLAGGAGALFVVGGAGWSVVVVVVVGGGEGEGGE